MIIAPPARVIGGANAACVVASLHSLSLGFRLRGRHLWGVVTGLVMLAAAASDRQAPCTYVLATSGGVLVDDQIGHEAGGQRAAQSGMRLGSLTTHTRRGRDGGCRGRGRSSAR